MRQNIAKHCCLSMGFEELLEIDRLIGVTGFAMALKLDTTTARQESKCGGEIRTFLLVVLFPPHEFASLRI